jgi:hypothetical protein
MEHEHRKAVLALRSAPGQGLDYPANRRQLDAAQAVKLEHQSAADHVANVPLALPPLPGSFFDKRLAARSRMRRTRWRMKACRPL